VIVRPGITVIVSTGSHKFNVTDAILPLTKAATGRFLVEQNPPAALDLADRGYMLRTGRVVLKGSTSCGGAIWCGVRTCGCKETNDAVRDLRHSRRSLCTERYVNCDG